MNTDILLARQAARRRAEAKRAVPNSAPSVAFVTHNLDEEVGKTVHEKGYLVKQGEKVKSWKKRYFVLTGTMLRWFVASSNRSPRRRRPERGALLRRYEDEKGYKGGKPKGEIECAGMKFAVGGSQARVRWFRPRARPHITCRVAPHTSA